MRVKKLVSLLLAVMLVVGMVPLNASANEPAVDAVEVQMIVSKTAPTQVSGYTKVDKNSSATALEGNVSKANTGWTWEGDGTSVTVGPGELVYVGFKVKHNKKEGSVYTGLANASLIVQYDKNVLLPADLSAESDGYVADPGYVAGSDFAGLTTLNDATSGVANEGYSKLTYSAEGVVDNVQKYVGAAEVNNASGWSTNSGEFTGTGTWAINSAKNKQYMASASESTWDFVVPMVVKDAASLGNNTSGYVKIIPNELTAKTEIVMSKVTLNNNTPVNDVTQSESLKLDGSTVKSFTHNEVTIKVATPGIEAVNSVVATGDPASIKVKANDLATFDTTECVKADNWTVATNGSGSPAVTAAAYDETSKVVTLTVTDVQTGTVTVTGTNVVKANSDNSVVATASASVEAKAAPVASFDYSNNKLITTETTGDVEYKLNKTGAGWLELNKADGVAISATDLDAIVQQGNNGAANTVKVADVRWKNTELVTAVNVTRAAQPADLTIDYEDEEITVPTTVEYKVGTGSYSDGTGSATNVNAGTAEQTITYRTKATGAALASTDKTLTVPARPTLTIEDANDATAKKNGQTKVTVTGTGAVYIVDQANNTTTMTGAKAFPEDGVVNATTAQYIHAQIPAVANTSFKSEVKHLPGSGNTFATVDFPASLVPGTTFELDLHNGTWHSDVDTIKTALTVTGHSNSVASVARKSDTKIEVTLTNDMAVSDSYTITVAQTALAASKNLSKDGTTDAGTSVTSDSISVTGNGVNVKVVDQNGNALNNTAGQFVAAGTQNAAITYTVPDGKRVKSIALGTSAHGTAAKDDNNAITFTANGNVTGSKNDHIITVTLEQPVTPDFTSVTHTWDGKSTLTANEIASIVWKDTTTSPNTQTGTLADVTFSLVDADKKAVTDVGTATLSWTAGTLTTSGGAEYVIDAGTQANFMITKADFGSVAFDTVSVTEDTIENVAKKIAATTATITTANNVEVKTTVGAFISESDIFNLILNAEKAEAETKAEAEKTAALIKDVAEEMYKNDATNNSTGAEPEYDSNNQPSGDFATWLTNHFWTATDDETSKTYAQLVQDAGDEAKNAVTATSTVKAGTVIDLSSLNVSTTIADADVSKYVNDPSPVPSNPLTTVTVNSKPSSGGGSYSPSIELVTGGFGTADSEVVLDENGKITKLPGVLNQKLGTVFKGWATQAGNPNTIVKIGREVTTDTTLYAIFEGYMSGDTVNGKKVARPNDSVTRGELVTMLVRATGLYDATIDYTTSFADAKDGWYAPYIGCAETAGIFTGDAEGTARPKDAITREEAAILIAKAFKVNVAIGGTTEYVKDFASVSDWAADFVAAIVNNGTSIGYAVDGGYEFQAKNEITRAEVAAMINKYIGLTEELKSTLAADETVKSPFTDVQNRNSWIYANMVFATLNAPVSSYVTEVTMPTRSK